jgi:predicted dehydrogenase
MAQPIHAVLIGAGQRGADSYAPYALAHPEEIRFVAVAEPDPARRERFALQHLIPPENCFADWQDLLARPQFGQAALVCTQDWQHTAPALAALHAGYDVLLEKPMAPTAAECIQLVQASEETGRQLHICHVLRFTPHFKKLREVIRSGVLGQIINVSHRENVAYWHMAHSYVRGNWCNTAQSSPMILAKCCHDLDILPWMLGDRAEQLSSVGSLLHYKPENAPAGATRYCLDGCPAADTCPYYAPFVYLGLRPMWRTFAERSAGFNRLASKTYLSNPGLVRAASHVIPALKQITDHREWPVSVLTSDPTPENILAALKDGPYGRCVYRCDNDVVDHQVVSMQFGSGASVTLTMQGHSDTEHRYTRIEGARGTLDAVFSFGGSHVEVVEHRSGRRVRYDTNADPGAGHGGGDFGLMAAFVRSLNEGPSGERSTAQAALESHLMAFAAERARLEKTVVTREQFLSPEYHLGQGAAA